MSDVGLDKLVLLKSLVRTRDEKQAELDAVDEMIVTTAALAQAHGVGVRALGAALGVSKSTAGVIAQRGKAKLASTPCSGAASEV